MFLLEIQTIVRCSMLDKLVELCKKRFGEHYRRIRKPKNNDTFLYQHFKRTGHSPNNVIVQPVEKIPYDKNSSVRFKTSNDLKLNLNGVNYCKRLFHWDLTTAFTMRIIFPKCQILMYLYFQGLVNVNLDLMVYGQRVMTNVHGALQ